jgi:iron(III) transport system permease protein
MGTAALVAAITLLPIGYLVVRVIQGGADAWSVLTRPGTVDVLLSTGALVVGVVLCAIAIGVPLAWLVTRTDLPGRRIIAVLAALPIVIPSYVAALALLGAFGPRGLLQQALAGPFGVERIPEIFGFPGALLALTLSTYPYVFLLCAAAMRSADPGLEEASRSLGRSARSTFFHVTLPMLRPAIGAASLLTVLYVLSDFGAVALMQYDSLTRAIYLQYLSLFDRTPAAVLGLVLVVLTALVLFAESRSSGGRTRFRVGPGAGRAPRLLPLGRWKTPALIFSWTMIGFFLFVPLAVLGYWLQRTLARSEPLEVAWNALGTSVAVAAAAAGVALLASLPVALVARRGRSRAGAFLERAAYTPNALPGIVIALALVFFAVRYGGPIYQTVILLLIAYVIRFLPQALAGSSMALQTINPRVEEAARSLGKRPLRVAATITLPLARSGMLAGATLVFLSTLKELPATLLLRPIGFDTLATEVWKFTEVGAYSRAALPALLLIAVAAPFVWFLSGRRGAALGSPG